MKLCYMYSNKFSKFKELFISSLKDSFQLIEMNCEDPVKDSIINDASTWGGGHKFWLARIDYIIELCKHEEEPFIFSDLDIIFYNPVMFVVTEMLKYYDLIFQKENNCGDVNVGFMAIRPKKTIQFWEEIREKVKNGMWEQGAVNERLKSNCDIKWSTFPESFWSYSQGKHLLNSSIILHHANCATGEDKFKQFKNVKKLLKEIKC